VKVRPPILGDRLDVRPYIMGRVTRTVQLINRKHGGPTDQIVPQLLAQTREVRVLATKTQVFFHHAQPFETTIEVGVEDSILGQLIGGFTVRQRAVRHRSG